MEGDMVTMIDGMPAQAQACVVCTCTTLVELAQLALPQAFDEYQGVRLVETK